MANVVNKNPMVLDTVDATAFWQQRIHISAIKWDAGAAAAAGDAVSLTDKDGNEIFASIANGAEFKDDVGFAHPASFVANGLKLPTLDAGKLTIYWR